MDRMAAALIGTGLQATNLGLAIEEVNRMVCGGLVARCSRPSSIPVLSNWNCKLLTSPTNGVQLCHPTLTMEYRAVAFQTGLASEVYRSLATVDWIDAGRW